MNDRANARHALIEAGAATTIQEELRPQIDAAADEVRDLTEQAELLRARVEEIWNERLSALTRAHDAHLRQLFPKGVPSTCYLEFEVLSGQDEVYKAFHSLLRILHNTAADYPNLTRDPR
jgi:hypothetical protein